VHLVGPYYANDSTLYSAAIETEWRHTSPPPLPHASMTCVGMNRYNPNDIYLEDKETCRMHELWKIVPLKPEGKTAKGNREMECNFDINLTTERSVNGLGKQTLQEFFRPTNRWTAYSPAQIAQGSRAWYDSDNIVTMFIPCITIKWITHVTSYNLCVISFAQLLHVSALLSL